MTIWNLRGTDSQNRLIREALDACDFPFEEMFDSLRQEGKSSIEVTWEDLSRYMHGAESHEHAEGAHTIVREVDGRMAVLGLFYLPPYTKVVMHTGLESRPALAHEVFLAEGAHAVDYHYMVPRDLRRHVWNALHEGHQDVADGTTIPESGDLGHDHSWFDGPGGYNSWVGESFMMAFTKAFAPSVQTVIQLDHPVSETAAAEIRAALLAPLAPPEPEPTPVPEDDAAVPPVEPSGDDSSVGSAPYFRSSSKSKVFHDTHKRLEQYETFDSVADAQAAGLRPCGVCKPT